MGDVKKIKSSNFNSTDIINLRIAGFSGISDTRIRAENLLKCVAIIFNDSLVPKIYQFFQVPFHDGLDPDPYAELSQDQKHNARIRKLI
jgi:hypothetical protein